MKINFPRPHQGDIIYRRRIFSAGRHYWVQEIVDSQDGKIYLLVPLTKKMKKDKRCANPVAVDDQSLCPQDYTIRIINSSVGAEEVL